ncbi:MAG: hypothetical protein EKK47_00480 [Burkholderiales bacterium]|jgi:hypothetical protein|nr:MAG: hypothetical protein EKK47_00480 [Burkholderiales bacterium]
MNVTAICASAYARTGLTIAPTRDTRRHARKNDNGVIVIVGLWALHALDAVRSHSSVITTRSHIAPIVVQQA